MTSTDAAAATTAPRLPDGLVVIVKRECATCQMVAPLLTQLPCTVYTQDDPTFPEGVAALHDGDLSVSWHLEIDTVPTLIRVVDGVEVERTIGWDRAEWRRLTGVDTLGDDLPVSRPGCGSMSVDPDLVDELRARFEGGTLRSRRVELADADDDIEAMYVRGWSDGLPVVPPTPERVLRMLTGTDRDPAEVVATVPPDLAPVTVEKVAINAVLAGCLPEYLPWVLAGVEAICTNEFNIHGVLCTTMPVGPILVCNGPGATAIGMNGAANVFGQGCRANLTIGRAVQLVVRNVGGGRPGVGGVDRATHGNPGKIGFCFAERTHDSPFAPLAESRGMPAGTDAITVFAGEGPRCVIDQKVRHPEELANLFAAALLATHSPKSFGGLGVMVVVGPEHGRVLSAAGWDRERFHAELMARLTKPGRELVAGYGGLADGLPASVAEIPAIPKFRPEAMLIVHAGGDAGLFSAIIGGWASGALGSTPVTIAVSGDRATSAPTTPITSPAAPSSEPSSAPSSSALSSSAHPSAPQEASA